MKTWDFYHNWLGRRGIDGAGYYLLNRVHFGSNYNNAGWNGRNIFYGDGDGYRWYPFVTTDISAHEFTHGVIEKTMNGNFFSNQGMAMGESFGDSMGTMVEFYVGIRPDYLYAEDNTVGQPSRSLENPPSINNDPDHFLNYHSSRDPHDNAGIQNKAFYLMAEGGTHPFSKIYVSQLGRYATARIFYNALKYLRPDATFYHSRQATLQAAADLYGSGSGYHFWTTRAWDAVGVQANNIDDTRFYVKQQYIDHFSRNPDQGGWDAWTNVIESCGTDAQCRSERRIDTAHNFITSPEFLNKYPNPYPYASPEWNDYFVRQCYAVYLHRFPEYYDQSGWEHQGWVNHLNNGGPTRTVVWGLTYSYEYRRRFGPA